MAVRPDFDLTAISLPTLELPITNCLGSTEVPNAVQGLSTFPGNEVK